MTRSVDPVTLQVLVSRLSGIVQEMQQNIFRTGYSTIVRESHDASCMLMDADGEVIGEHAVLPLHVGCMPPVVQAIRAAFGDDIHAGDAFITNHPYVSGVPHAMDMAVIAPVFHGDRLIAFSGSIAHKSDLGGMIPGTGYAAARELFQEGVQYPPVRLVARGVMQRDVEAILRANSRTPDLIMGDLRGQIGVARLGERRLEETVEKYGVATLLAVFADVHRLSEERLRAALRMWPDGAYEAESFVDTDGIDLERRVRYHVRVEKTGGRIHFDFSQSDDQVTGPINIQPALARSCLYYAIVGFVDPTLPNNAGVARVVETTFRPGSVLNAHYPGRAQHIYGVGDRAHRSRAASDEPVRARAPTRRQRRRRRQLDRGQATRRFDVRAIRTDRFRVRRGARAATAHPLSTCCFPTAAPRRSKFSRANIPPASSASN